MADLELVVLLKRLHLQSQLKVTYVSPTDLLLTSNAVDLANHVVAADEVLLNVHALHDVLTAKVSQTELTLCSRRRPCPTGTGSHRST